MWSTEVEKQGSPGHGSHGNKKLRQIRCSASKGTTFINAMCHSGWRSPLTTCGGPLSLFWKLPRDFLTHLMKQPFTFLGRRISRRNTLPLFGRGGGHCQVVSRDGNGWSLPFVSCINSSCRLTARASPQSVNRKHSWCLTP